jgi:hypothetical protein
MKIGEFITGVALVAFILALCSIESLSVGALATMFVSGTWLVGYGFVSEEMKRERDGR